MSFTNKEILQFVAAAQKRPTNRLTVKLSMLILSAQEYVKQDQTKGYRYQAFDNKSEGIVTFTSSRLLKKGEPAEVLLVLNGFTAFER
jgi:hypothetical protein